jgi:hypothetical protein
LIIFLFKNHLEPAVVFLPYAIYFARFIKIT